MIDGPSLPLVVITALGCGLVSGVLFVFSAFIMQALKRLPPERGISAVQSINITAVRPPLMIVFFGTAAALVAVAVWAIAAWSPPTSIYLILGAALYLTGTILMTGVYHVPRNNKLAALDPKSIDAARYWVTYGREWTRWNHVRTIAALLASALLITAIVTP